MRVEMRVMIRNETRIQKMVQISYHTGKGEE